MDLTIGQTELLKRSFTQEDFNRFAEISGDDNPIHCDPDFSAGTRFGRTVSHGMLLYSTLCRLLATRCPGAGTLQIKQDLMFQAPTFADTQVTFKLEVVRLDTRNQLMELTTQAILPDGSYACDGATLVHPPGWRRGFPGRVPDMPISRSSGTKILKQLTVGQSASIQRIFTAQDNANYADLTGDTNPFIMDASYARRFGFQNCLVPGPLLSGMFSNLLGTKLPGRGTNWLKQNLHYPAPAYLGQEITATVAIVRLRTHKNLVNLIDTCTNPSGEVVCQGRSLVLVKELEE